jgi:hypothetical protein
MNGYTEGAERVKQGAAAARALYRSARGPSRAQSRGVSGGTIGAAPTTAGGTRSGGSQGSRGRSENYEANLAAKQARDRETVAKSYQRPRSAGPMPGRQASIPGGGSIPGAGAGGTNSTAALAGMPWMSSPYYWLGIGAIAFLLLRKKKKKNGNGS